ncbi:MAG TPA: hypothetical protein PKA16_04195 [Ottowia sp.]|mgnify:CR=1 FL=1|uniref:hypothetical protein n=1 Tax=Ottowia sp. TaxID=1898956 RepID=UPI002C67ED4D|nr:hypothetical protein [Ottowia sp.]HMN20576.1 hypothetical protein [Ottowia sp.]
MSFDRTRLPDSLTYFEGSGLKLTGRGKWRTAPCIFHGGSDSMRVNLETGGWVCMAGCGARGGDVLAYEMASAGRDFATAAKALGAWIEDGKPAPIRPTPISARDALGLLADEADLIALAGARVGRGAALNDEDRARVLTAAGRVRRIRELFA